MKRCLLVTLFLLTMAVFPARAASYVVALDATWPPFEFLNTKGEVTGYTVDLVAAISREGGFAVDVKASTWDGLFARLNQGKYDIIASSVTITEERQKQMDFSLPYFETSQHLLLPASSDAKTFADLKNKVLGAQTGTMGQNLVNSHAGFIIKPYDGLVDAIEALAEGKIEGVVCDRPVAQYYSNTDEFRGKIKPASFPITDVKEFYGFAVRKGDKELLALINNGLTAVKNKGIEREIYTKWFGAATITH